MKGYSIQIGIPMSPIKLQKTLAKTKDLEGIIAASPQGEVLFLVFDTWLHARAAQIKLKEDGESVGTNIMNVKITKDMQTLEIGEPARWEDQ